VSRDEKMSGIRAVTFDCYGTLVDWETGIAAATAKLLDDRGTTQARSNVLESFARYEAEYESRTPIMPYHDVLRAVISAMGRDWKIEFTADETLWFADSIGRWPLFADVLPVLRTLHGRVVVGILSNVDRRSFRRTEPAFEGLIDVCCIAEEIGAYKPAPKAFETMLERLADRAIGREEVLHVAQSLFHDHAPASALGIETCWLDRRHGQEGWGAVVPPRGEVRPAHRITSMSELPAMFGLG
jgi:2-haloacid dehalogenase